MLGSIFIIFIWCYLRIKDRHNKNDKLSMLILLLIANTLRTITIYHISETLLYIIPLQNNHHPKKVFLCLPFVGILASVSLQFNYDRTILSCAFILLIWLSNKQPQQQQQTIKNRSISKTWINHSDSIIINHNDQYQLIITKQGKVISQHQDIYKLFGTDDNILIQQILNEIIIIKLEQQQQQQQQQQYKSKHLLEILQYIKNNKKIRILECNISFGNNYIIDLYGLNDNHIGIIFIDIYTCREYWERKITKQLMNQLFRSFSHEFSTSLNCIRLLAENAIDDIDDDFIVNTCIIPILNSCYILNSIVQDVRDFSLILSKNFILTIQQQNLYLLINEVADLYRQQLNMKGVELIIQMNELYIHTDGQRFKQVLNNLLSNAQKFTFKGNVTIQLQEIYSKEQLYIKVIVSDTGSGMDQDTQKRLTEFLKQPNQRNQNFNYGLGLMISHNICNGLSPNYESGIHFESQPNNTSFWFYLEDLKMLETPDVVSKRTIKYNKVISSGRSILEQSFLFSPSDKKRQSSFTFSIKGKQKLIEKQSENLSDAEDNIIAPYIFREGPKKPRKHNYPSIDLVISEYAEDKAKILIVDDEYVNIYALTTMLHRLNIKCDSTHNGKEGLENFKKNAYNEWNISNNFNIRILQNV